MWVTLMRSTKKRSRLHVFVTVHCWINRTLCAAPTSLQAVIPPVPRVRPSKLLHSSCAGRAAPQHTAAVLLHTLTAAK